MKTHPIHLALSPSIAAGILALAGCCLGIILVSSALDFSPEVEHRFVVPGLGAYAQLGTDVDVSGDTAVLGCPGFVINQSRVGAALVFVLRDGEWTPQVMLIPDGAPANTGFGYSVAISHDTIVVGAYRDDAFGPYSGAAYVFSRSEDVWTFDAKLSPADAEAGLQFGDPVAIDGDRLAVGAIADNVTAFASGAVYVFHRDSDGWQQEAKLKANTPVAGALFGLSISVCGDLLAAGAPYHNYDSRSSAGAAYVFQHQDDAWVELAELTADDATDNSLLGWSVAIAPNRLLVGAPRAQHNSKATGAAYLFQPFESGWSQSDKLTDAQPGDSAWFGFAVALHSDTAAIGASQDSEFGPSAGAICLFSAQADLWQQTHKFNTTPPSTGSQLGFSLAYNGYHLVAGAPFHSDAPMTQLGAAFVFSPPPPPPPNQPPVADASATLTSVLALNAVDAEVLLDGSRSSDPDSSELSFHWYANGTWIAGTPIAIVRLGAGSHTILLEVNDGSITSTDSLELNIGTPAQAIDELMDQLQDAVLPAGQARALEQFLMNAHRAAERNQLSQTLHHLQVAQHYLSVQAGKRIDPLTARQLADAIQQLAQALGGA